MEKLLEKLLHLPSQDVINLLYDKHLGSWKTILKALPQKDDTLLMKTLQLIGLKLTEFSGAFSDDGTHWSRANQLHVLTVTCESPPLINTIKNKIVEWSTMKGKKDDLQKLLLLVYSFCKEILRKIPEMGKVLLFSMISTIAEVAWMSLHVSDVEETYIDGFRDLAKKIEKKSEVLEVQQRKRRFMEFCADFENQLHDKEPPDDFRLVDLVPDLVELVTLEEPFLRPNKVQGPYRSSTHYLDVQFRLLREDFARPLREGVREYVMIYRRTGVPPNQLKESSVRLYTDVTLKCSEISTENGMDYLFNLPRDLTQSVNWDKSKRLLPGCLVMLTSDNCRSAVFAITLPPPFERNRRENGDHRRRELSKGVLRLLIETKMELIDKSKKYKLFECEAYFEAYKHNLKILQDIDFLDVPGSIAQKYIVQAFSSHVHVDMPAYLRRHRNSRKPVMLRLPLPASKDGKDGDKSFLLPEGKPRCLNVPVGDANSWDTWKVQEQMGLNNHQYEALKMTFNSEIALIQGPPGTGKTFVGLQIVKILCANKMQQSDVPAVLSSQYRTPSSLPASVVPNSPILVLCYTNHALDQFLELILKNIKDAKIVRVGGQCKSDILQEYTLANLRKQAIEMIGLPESYKKQKREEACAANRLRYLEERISRAKLEVEELVNPNGVFKFREMEISKDLRLKIPSGLWKDLHTTDWLAVNTNWFLEGVFQLEQIFSNVFVRDVEWVKNNLQRYINRWEAYNMSELAGANVSEKQGYEDFDMDELLEQRIFEDEAETQKRTHDAQQYKDNLYFPTFSVKSCLKRAEECGCQTNRKEEKVHFQNQGSLIRAILALQRDGMLGVENFVGVRFECSNCLANEARYKWGCYFKVVRIAIQCERDLISKLEADIVEAKENLDKARERLFEAKGVFLAAMEALNAKILQGAHIVGMTTTGAAKNYSLLKKAQAKIVIVEEAAEILEAHIVTALTRDCEHLILIGDHLQLRPSTTVYELGRRYRMNVSLFERMIKNGVPFCTLKTQHRMRPEISNLIIGTIYDELLNHEKVYHFGNIRGVSRNMFFVDHREKENNDADLLSKSNKHEATFLAELCSYLVFQGYKKENITILTMYAGQMFLLKKLVARQFNCRGVRITCVDSYQGEENDIILLSLVRSNVDNNVGFVGIDNRVCVALSRARHGLYIVGNMGCLSGASRTWRHVDKKLSTGCNIGKKLELFCGKHGRKSEVASAEDFKLVKDGGCTQVCGDVLPCDHFCPLTCHRNEEDVHTTYNCKVPVWQRFSCGHMGNVPCHGNMKDCQCVELVEKILRCGHTQMVKCGESIMGQFCKFEVDFRFNNCGHQCKVKCGEMGYAKCTRRCNTMLRCKHRCGEYCHVNIDPRHLSYRCQSKCIRRCRLGHPCTGKHSCHERCPPCKVNVTKWLKCKHKTLLECHKPVDYVECQQFVPGRCGYCDQNGQVKCGLRNLPQKMCKSCLNNKNDYPSDPRISAQKRKLEAANNAKRALKSPKIEMITLD